MEKARVDLLEVKDEGFEFFGINKHKK